jgi:tRNA(Ile)-lysidine synthase
MLDNIETLLREQCGLSKNRPVMVGVSGGPDSLCLMEALRQAGYPLIAAHFNHRLRAESDVEAAQVEKTAAQAKLPYVCEAGDVRLYAEKHGMSVEEAARHMRYIFLFRQARKHAAQAIAVGHTADDQVETVLLHFLRGAGLNGLKGMPYRTVLPAFDAAIPIVRPLLDIWREETMVYCAANGLHPVMDPSNDSLDFTRNRLRKLLIPALETYNPRFKEAVWRSTQVLQGDHELLRETIEEAWRGCVVQASGDLIVFDLPQLLKCSRAMQRNLMRTAVEKLQPGQETTFAVLNRATAFLGQSAGRRTDLVGGLKLFREESSLFVCTPAADLPFDKWPQMPDFLDPVPINAPGLVEISGGWKLSCESWRLPALAREQAERNEDPFQVWLDVEALPGPLVLRTRLPGDRFEPLGMDGHSQKLSDFLVNEKMPQRARDRWPLLCAEDKVVWVPGYRPAHPYRLTSLSRKILYFSLMRPPEKARTEM